MQSFECIYLENLLFGKIQVHSKGIFYASRTLLLHNQIPRAQGEFTRIRIYQTWKKRYTSDKWCWKLVIIMSTYPHTLLFTQREMASLSFYSESFRISTITVSIGCTMLISEKTFCSSNHHQLIFCAKQKVPVSSSYSTQQAGREYRFISRNNEDLVQNS